MLIHLLLPDPTVSRAEIRSVIDAWALETGQQVRPQPPCSPSIGADGVPTGMPKDGTATMLAVEVAKGEKGPGKKGGGKGKGSPNKKSVANKKKK